MKSDQTKKLFPAVSKAHPWHGVSPGDRLPAVVTVFVEIVPTDTVKFEIDKVSGHLMVDRPQKFSNQCPTLYGFIPQTFCHNQVAKLSSLGTTKSGKKTNQIKGDNDPLDICVITERTILHGDIIVRAKPIGGLRLIDRNEADDKIIAVLEGDSVYGDASDIKDIPSGLLDRIQHYFLTYKQMPGSKEPSVRIAGVYGRSAAQKVIMASRQDYHAAFGS